jgi:Icc-related predicted phosphoesterase
MIRLVALSDTHGGHFGVKVPDGDIVVHAGDFCAHGGYRDAHQFLAWFNTLPHQHKILIAGNHDILFEKDPGLAKNLLREFPAITYLEDSAAEVAGLKFWGSPVQPRFFNWAFNRDRGEEIKHHWDMIPEGIDVLVTHGPPHGICDEAYRVGYNITEHTGCRDLMDAVLRTAPKLHLFGHIHYSGQTSYIAPKTTFANVSQMNEGYILWGKPMVFEFDFEHTVSIV